MLGFSVGKSNVRNHVPITIVLSVFKLVKIDVKSCWKMFRTWFGQLIIGFAQAVIEDKNFWKFSLKREYINLNSISSERLA